MKRLFKSLVRRAGKKCDYCHGAKDIVRRHWSGIKYIETCPKCKGTGKR